MPSKKIPEGWNDYSALGRRIEKTRFVCFKVPLKKEVLNSQRVPDEERFSPEDLIQLLAERDEELGVIIDLTNTDRYYDSTIFTQLGIEHRKIFTQGRIVPQPPVTNKFTEYVNDFIKENDDNDKLIGVHCTHGLNRTGYIVCRYMVDHMGFTPEDALKAFNTARGHEMERENFINALHGRPYVDPPNNQFFRQPRIDIAPVTRPRSRSPHRVRSRSPHRAPRQDSRPSRGRPPMEGRPRVVERPPRRMDWPAYGEGPRRREEWPQRAGPQGAPQHNRTGQYPNTGNGPSRYRPADNQHHDYNAHVLDTNNWRHERTPRMRQPEYAPSNRDLDRRRGNHGYERYPDERRNFAHAAQSPPGGYHRGDQTDPGYGGRHGNPGYHRGDRGNHPDNGAMSHHHNNGSHRNDNYYNNNNNRPTPDPANTNWRPKNGGQGQGQGYNRERRNPTRYQRPTDGRDFTT